MIAIPRLATSMHFYLVLSMASATYFISYRVSSKGSFKIIAFNPYVNYREES